MFFTIKCFYTTLLLTAKLGMDEAKRFYFIFPDLHKKTKIRKHFFSTSSFIDHHNPVSSHVLISFSFSHLNGASLPRENPFVIAFHKRED